MVKNWLGRKGLHFKESLTSDEKDACSLLEGLFQILTNKFRPQFNKTIKPLQFCKLRDRMGKCGRIDWKVTNLSNRM